MYSSFFSSSKCSLFRNSNVFGSCFKHILYTGYAKMKKNNSGAKRLNHSAAICWVTGKKHTHTHTHTHTHARDANHRCTWPSWLCRQAWEILSSKFSYATPGIGEDTRIQGEQGAFQDSTFSFGESNHVLRLNEQRHFPVPFIVLSSLSFANPQLLSLLCVLDGKKSRKCALRLSRCCSDANRFAAIHVMVPEFSAASIRCSCARHDCNDEARKMMTSLDGQRMVGNYGESFAVWCEGTYCHSSTNCVAYRI